MSNSSDHEWLSLPSGISVTSHDSFTKDLLRQFDKKKHQILYGEDLISIDKKSTHTNPSALRKSFVNSIHSSLSSPMLQDNDDDDNMSSSTEAEESTNANIEAQGSRRRSAGNLLRKSSLYLRNKFNQNKPVDFRAALFHSWTLKNRNNNALSKIAIHTTIPIAKPEQSSIPHPFQPPVITQYPPKPLKYSPVEPLPEEIHHKSFHSLSLPLFTHHTKNVQRARSDTELQSNNRSLVFKSLSRKWNKLIDTFKKVS